MNEYSCSDYLRKIIRLKVAFFVDIFIFYFTISSLRFHLDFLNEFGTSNDIHFETVCNEFVSRKHFSFILNLILVSNTDSSSGSTVRLY